MNAAELYRQHAGECREMASLVRDLDSRARWRRIAERWFRCAEQEEARYRSSRHVDAASPRKRLVSRRATPEI